MPLIAGGGISSHEQPWTILEIEAAAVHAAALLLGTELLTDGAGAHPAHRAALQDTATDFIGFNAPRPADQGAAIALHLATLPDDGPRGGFFNDGGTVP